MAVSLESGGDETLRAADGLRALFDDHRAETEAALQIVHRITSSLDLADVVRESTNIVATVTGADSVLFYLYDEEGQRHHVRAGLPADERWVDVHSFEPPTLTRGARVPGDAPRLIRGAIPAEEGHLAHPDRAAPSRGR